METKNVCLNVFCAIPERYLADHLKITGSINDAKFHVEFILGFQEKDISLKCSICAVTLKFLCILKALSLFVLRFL